MSSEPKQLNITGSSNTFRFQTFAERVAAIDVDVVHQVKRQFELDEAPALGEKGAFFSDELQRWTELEISRPFKRLRRQLVHYGRSMAQLIYHKKTIVDFLLEALKTEPTIWKPVLELIAVLARDLRAELYPHFKTIVTELVAFIDPTKPEVTGATFRALSYVFKFLAPTLLTHLDEIRGFYGPLLGHKRPFVRSFAAESFALLLRRLPAQKAAKHITGLVKAMGVSAARSKDISVELTQSAAQARRAGTTVEGRPEELKDGIAALLFDTLKGVQRQLHSKAEVLLTALFVACRPKHRASSKGTSDDLDEAAQLRSFALRFEVVLRGCLQLLEHVDNVSAAVLFRVVHQESQALFSSWLTQCRAVQNAAAATTASAKPTPKSAKKRTKGSATHEEPASSSGAASKAPSACMIAATGVAIGRIAELLRLMVVHRGGTRVGTGEGRRLVALLKNTLAPDHWYSAHMPQFTKLALLRLLLVAWPYAWEQTGSRKQSGQSKAKVVVFGEDDEADVDTRPLRKDTTSSAAVGIKLVRTILLEEDVTASVAASKVSDAEAMVLNTALEPSLQHVTNAQLILGFLRDLLVTQGSRDPSLVTRLMPTLSRFLDNQMQSAVSATEIWDVRSLMGESDTHKEETTASQHIKTVFSAVLSFRDGGLQAHGSASDVDVADMSSGSGLFSHSVAVDDLKQQLTQHAPAIVPAQRGAVDDGTLSLAAWCTHALQAGAEALLVVLSSGSNAAVAASTPGKKGRRRKSTAAAEATMDSAAQQRQLRHICELALVLTQSVPAITLNAAELESATAALKLIVDCSLQFLTSTSDATSLRGPRWVILSQVAASSLRSLSMLGHRQAIAATVAQSAAPQPHHANDDSDSEASVHSSDEDEESEAEAADTGATHTESMVGTIGLDSIRAMFEGSTAATLMTTAVSWLRESMARVNTAAGIPAALQSQEADGTVLAVEDAKANLLNAIHATGLMCAAARAIAPEGLMLSNEHLEAVTHVVADGLALPERSIRLACLNLLNCFEQPAFADPQNAEADGVAVERRVAVAAQSSDSTGAADLNVNDSIYIGESHALRICRDIEATEDSVDQERTKVMHLTQLQTMIRSRRVPRLHKLCIARWLFGTLYVRFAPLWKPVCATLGLFAELETDIVWPVLCRQLYLATVTRKAAAEGNTQDVFDGQVAVNGCWTELVDASILRDIMEVGRYRQANFAAKSRGAGRKVDFAARMGRPAESLGVLRWLDVAGLPMGGALVDLAHTRTVVPGPQELSSRLVALIGTAAPSMLTTQIDNRRVLALPMDGFVDSELYHKSILQVIGTVPRLAEQKSRTIVPVFLAFIRDDYYGAANRDDPDAWELKLDDCIEELVHRSHQKRVRPTDTNSAQANKRQRGSLTKGDAADEDDDTTTVDDLNSLEVDYIDALLTRGTRGQRRGGSADALGNKTSGARLLNFLHVFEKFKNWKTLYGSPLLQALLARLLIKPDSGVAQLAATCLFNCKLPYLTPYREGLEPLFDDKRYRDFFVDFRPEPDAGVIQHMHRTQLIPLIVRGVYGRLLQRKGKSARDTPAARRAVALAYLSSLEAPELSWLMYLSMRIFVWQAAMQTPIDTAPLAGISGERRITVVEQSEQAALRVVSYFRSGAAPATISAAEDLVRNVRLQDVAGTRVIGFLRLLPDMVKKLGVKLQPFLHHILAVLIRLLGVCSEDGATVADEEIEQANDEDGDDVAEDDDDNSADSVDANQAALQAAADARNISVSVYLKRKAIRTEVMGCLMDIFRVFPDHVYEAWMPLLLGIVEPAVLRLPSAVASARKPPVLLRLFEVMSQHGALAPYLASMPSIISAIVSSINGGYLVNHPECVTDTATDTALSSYRAISQGSLLCIMNVVDHLLELDPTVVQRTVGGTQTYGWRNAAALRASDEAALAAAQADLEESPESTELARQQAACTGLLLPFIEPLLQEFALRLQAKKAGKPVPGSASRRELFILARLSQYAAGDAGVAGGAGKSRKPVASAAMIGQIVFLLLPFINRRRGRNVNEESRDEEQIQLFTILTNLVPLLKSAVDLLPRLTQMLGPGPNAMAGTVRQSLMLLFEKACHHPSVTGMVETCNLLQGANAVTGRSLDVSDHEEQHKAYAQIALHETLSGLLQHANQLAPIIQQCLYGLTGDEFAIRSAAEHALIQIVTVLSSGITVPKSAQAIVKDVEAPSPAFVALATERQTEIREAYMVNEPAVAESMAACKPLPKRLIGGLSLHLMIRHVIAGLKMAMRTDSSTNRAHVLQVWRQIGDSFAEHPFLGLYGDLRAMVNRENEDKDILLNLSHMQLYRRAHALGNIATLVDEGSFSASTIHMILLPLTMHSLHDQARVIDAAEGERKRRNRKTTEPTMLHNYAIELIAAIAKRTHWKEWLRLLRFMLRSVHSDPSLEKVFVRAACAVVDGFHFELPRDLDPETLEKLQQASAKALEAVPSDTSASMKPTTVPRQAKFVTDADEMDNEASDAESDKEGEEAAEEKAGGSDDEDSDAKEDEIASDADEDMEEDEDEEEEVEELQARAYVVYQTLLKQVLPAMRNLLIRKEKDEMDVTGLGAQVENGDIRVPIALTTVKLLQLMPEAILRMHLAGLLRRLCLVLKSRMHSQRDTARDVLSKISKQLGPEFIAELVSAMCDVLQEGYQVYVLGFTLFDVLSAVADELRPLTVQEVEVRRKLATVYDRHARELVRAKYGLGGDDLYEDEEGEDDLDLAKKHGVDPPTLEEVFESMLANEPDLPADPRSLPADVFDQTIGHPNRWVSKASRALVSVLPDIMNVVMDDALGERAAMRDDESGYNPRQKMKEIKTCKSFDTYEVLARVVPFLPHSAFHILLGPVIEVVGREHNSPKRTDQVYDLLRRAIIGLMKNQSIDAKTILIYAHSVIQEHLSSKGVAIIETARKATQRQKRFVGVSQWIVMDKAASTGSAVRTRDEHDADAAAKGAAGPSESIRSFSEAKSRAPEKETSLMVEREPRYTGHDRHGKLYSKQMSQRAEKAAAGSMLWFGLSVLLHAFRRRLVRGGTKEHRIMLDPFLPVLSQALESTRITKVQVAALRVVTVLLPFELPATKKVGTPLSRQILRIVEGSSGGTGETRSELAHSSLKACTVMIRACRSVKVHQEELRALLTLIRNDLNTPAKQAASLNLLKAIVARRLVVEEVYDIMDDIGKLFVRSLSHGVRQLAASVFLAYLMHYPLGTKRLEAHLAFLLKNLSYAYYEGRMAVLDMLHAIILKFPQAILDEKAQFMLLPLVLRLVNDKSSICRAGVGAVIKLLFQHVSRKTANILFDMALQWTQKDQKRSLRCIAAQVAALASEVAAPVTSRRCAEVLTFAGRELNAALGEFDQAQAELTGDATEEADDTDLLTAVAQADAHAREIDATARGTVTETPDSTASSAAAAPSSRPANLSAPDADGWVTVGAGGVDMDEVIELYAGEEADIASTDAPVGGGRVPVGKRGGGLMTDLYGTAATNEADAADAMGDSAGGRQKDDITSGVRADGSRTTSRAVDVELAWSMPYFTLVMLEHMWKQLPQSVEATIMSAVQGGVLEAPADAAEDDQAEASAAEGAKQQGRPKGKGKAALKPKADSVASGQVGSRTVAHTADSVVSMDADTIRALLSYVLRLLGHPHSWVKTAAGRVLAAYLARRDAAVVRSTVVDTTSAAIDASSWPAADPAAFWICDTNIRWGIARRLASQIGSLYLTESMADIAVRNLMFVVMADYRAGQMAQAAATSDNESDDEAGSGEDGGSVASAEGNEEDDNVDAGDGGGMLVEWCMKRLTYLTRNRSNNVARVAVLRWIGAIAAQMDAGDLQTQLPIVMRLLYKLLQLKDSVEAQKADRSNKRGRHRANTSVTDVALTAQQVFDHLQKLVGHSTVLEVYSAEQARLSRVAADRRKQRKMRAIVDPEGAAVQRAKKTSAKRRAKKRKVNDQMERRGKFQKR